MPKQHHLPCLFPLTAASLLKVLCCANTCCCSWVCPKVCAMYGISDSQAEAWEANGGGKWSRK
jgi:hypothetical protein